MGKLVRTTRGNHPYYKAGIVGRVLPDPTNKRGMHLVDFMQQGNPADSFQVRSASNPQGAWWVPIAHLEDAS